ncbi:zinc finger protein GLIS2 [Patella vulgata]|uniref:zinc finger protein GLIS2 n=1 Tax=Patella vulgata TaxID=6465 RepID=UPI00217FE00A|nr:zinc finger protein GLIS2 [Patella vulgata]XP_050416978.1 zinc finger protein GLIS2 [Patella vulgata]
MSGSEMVKHQDEDGVISSLFTESSPISIDTSSIITVNGLSPNIDQTYLYPVGTQQGCLTSSLPVYCTSCTQSSLIISPNSLRPGLITSSTLPQDAMVINPGIIGQIQTSQLPSNSFIKCEIQEPSKQPLSQSVHVYDCRWMNCDQRFLQLDDLVNHVNDHHVKVERPDVDYQCKWTGCQRQGRGFNARYKMLIHIRTHTNEKPHKCTRCGKCFSRLENLKIHNRSHTGEKPYTCPFQGCNKAYSNSSDRFKHVRTHQDQKPYICKMPGCNKRYTDPSSLRKHARTHGHNVKGSNSSQSFHDALCSEKGSELLFSTALPYTTININNNSNVQSNGDLSKDVNMQQTASVVSSWNLLPIASHVTELLPHVVTAIPSSLPNTDGSSSPTESDCQERPLDLSRSPISTPVTIATLTTQIVAD